jgi:hypothetical protein
VTVVVVGREGEGEKEECAQLAAVAAGVATATARKDGNNSSEKAKEGKWGGNAQPPIREKRI